MARGAAARQSRPVDLDRWIPEQREALGKAVDLVLDCFEGREVVVNDESGVVRGLKLSDAFASVEAQNSGVPVRVRVSALEAARVEWIKRHETKPGATVAPNAIYELAVAYVKAARRLAELRLAEEPQRGWLRTQRAKLELDQEALDESPEMEKDIEQARIDRRESMLEQREERLDAWSAELQDHALWKFLPVNSQVKAAKYFKDKYGLSLRPSTIGNCIRNNHLPQPKGRPRVVPVTAEVNLLKHALLSHRRGYPLTWRQVCELARQLTATREKAPSKTWFNGWLRRMKEIEPGLAHQYSSTIKPELVQSYSTETVNWWFDVTKKELVDLGAGSLNTDAGKPDELIWNKEAIPRVLFLDESGIDAKPSRQSKKSHAKRVVDLALAPTGGRARHPAISEEDSHITFVGGMTLDCRSPAVAMVIAGQTVSATVRSHFNEIAAKYLNSKKMGDVLGDHKEFDSQDLIFASPTGTVTRENVLQIYSAIVRRTYPDVSPEKPVFLFVDSHSIRQDPYMLTDLSQVGVHMFLWLPNTTSQCQPPNVAMLGIWKAKMQARRRALVAKRREDGTFVDSNNRKINKMDRIEIAAQAWSDTLSCRKRLAKGLEDTGMRPFTRQPHLSNSLIKTGDKQQESVAEPREAGAVVMPLHTGGCEAEEELVMASLEPGELSQVAGPTAVASGSATPDSRDSTTSESLSRPCSGSIDSVMTSISQRPRNLNQNLSFFKVSTPEELARVQKEVKSETITMRATAEMAIEIYLPDKVKKAEIKKMEIKKRYERDSAKADADFETKIAAEKAEHAAKIAAEKAEYEAKIAAAKAEYESKIVAAKANCEEMRAAAKSRMDLGLRKADDFPSEYKRMLENEIKLHEKAKELVEEDGDFETQCNNASTALELVQHARDARREADGLISPVTSDSGKYTPPPSSAGSFTNEPLVRVDQGQLSKTPIRATATKRLHRLETPSAIATKTNSTLQTSPLVQTYLVLANLARGRAVDKDGKNIMMEKNIMNLIAVRCDYHYKLDTTVGIMKDWISDVKRARMDAIQKENKAIDEANKGKSGKDKVKKKNAKEDAVWQEFDAASKLPGSQILAVGKTLLAKRPEVTSEDGPEWDLFAQLHVTPEDIERWRKATPSEVADAKNSASFASSPEKRRKVNV